MYVDVYVDTHIYTHIHIYKYTYGHTYTLTYTCTYTLIRTCMHAYIHTYTHRPHAPLQQLNYYTIMAPIGPNQDLKSQTRIAFRRESVFYTLDGNF